MQIKIILSNTFDECTYLVDEQKIRKEFYFLSWVRYLLLGICTI